MKKYLRAIQTFFPSLQDRRFAIQRSIRKWRGVPHEGDFRALSTLSIPQNGLLLDIGANRGEATQSMLMCAPQAQVMAFEPNPIIFEKLKAVYGKNSQVTLFNFGLGQKDQTFPLHIPFYRGYMFDGLSSFYRERAEDWLKGRIWGFKEKHLMIKKVECTIKVLDDLQLSPTFIKMDVQGFELEVLKGAEKTLLRSTPILLVETPENEISAYLDSLGYRAFTFDGGSWNIGHGRLNTFYMTPERWKALKDPRHHPRAEAQTAVMA